MQTRIIFFIFSLGIVLTGCTAKAKKEGRGFWDPLFSNDEYTQVYETWTKQDRLYSNFDVTAIADVTYWNTEVREAYVAAVAEDYRLSEEAAKTLALEQLTENEAYESFIVTLKTRQYGWSELGSSERLWSAQLENAEGTVKLLPKSIDPISDKDQRARQYYKNMDRFSKTYILRFPKAPLREASEIVFHLTGPIGSMSFSFERPAESPLTQ